MVEKDSKKRKRPSNNVSVNKAKDSIEGTQTNQTIPWGEEISQTRKRSRFVSQSDTIEDDQITRLVINKNDNINRRISKILQILSKDSVKERIEVLIIAKGEAIQKLITIVEITKQKLRRDVKQDQKVKQSKGEHNDRLAKIPGNEKSVIGNKVVNDLSYQVNQFNYLDYTVATREDIKEKETRKNKKKKGRSTGGIGYKKEELDLLKIDKAIKVPVMYVYMDFHQDGKVEPKVEQKYENLRLDGWTRQQE